MQKRMLALLVLLVPCVTFAGPMRYELDLLPGTVVEGYDSWDHNINNPTLGCAACHVPLDQLGPSGSVATPTKSGEFLLNALKVKFYGDTAHIGTYPNPTSTVAALRSTGTAAGYYLYPGRSTVQVPLVGPPTPLSSIVRIASGLHYNCAVTSVGGGLCWGENVFGQLGNGSTTGSAVPVPVSGLVTGVKRIAPGYYHACAITSTGGVVCWGSNTSGELGNNTTVNSTVPVPVAGLSSGVTAIAAGYDHTCAITSTGGVVCWGGNSFGQLGNNTTAYSSVPVPVAGLSSGVKAITAISVSTCAITAAGGVVCWGYNAAGQLGNNSTANSAVPAPVSGLSSGVTALASGSGSAHVCAITSAGGAVCWGSNENGVLGDNSVANSSVPVAVAGLSSGVKAIAIGTQHTCAVTSAGGAECWGFDVSGELGNGIAGASSLVPTPASSLTSAVTAISAGDGDTCAITSAGGAVCWGWNGLGQLGNGTPGTDHSATALPVLSGVTQTGVFSASIDPAAGWFVSVDGTHHSVGIGSGWPNLAPTFPGGIMSDSFIQTGTYVSPVDSYNLASTLAPVGGHQISDYLFPTGWPVTNTTVPLIGGGAMQINPQSPTLGTGGTKGTFTATALKPMNTFTAFGGWVGAVTKASIQVQGTLTLGTGGNLFAASADDVVFGFGPYTAVIPAGSLSQSVGHSSYSGNINGSPVQVTLTNTSGSNYSFSFAVQNANLTGLTPPISVDLYIGDNAGSRTPSPIAQTIKFGTLPTRITIGSTATLSATASSGLPVTFSTLTPSLCTVSGTTVKGVAAGTCKIAANQAGNGIYAAASSSALTPIVNKAASTTAVATSLNPSTFGHSVTFTATVSSPAGTPAGSVTFKDGTLTLGTGAISATTHQATYTTTKLAVGTHNMTAVYGGNADYLTSTSPVLKQVVK